ncbi:MAG TPA: extracellular solute-binding protein, partial [Beutenbergiaceae bacterium]|nr:extracellular solute-binding protein [Beutenbergiaceae bacterium]
MAKPPRKIHILTSGIFATALLAACGSPTTTGDEGAGGDDVETTEPSGDAAFTWAITGADKEIHEKVADLWNEENPDKQVEVAFLAPTADEQRQAMFQDLQSGAGEFDVLALDVVWTGEFADNEYITSLEEFRDDVEGENLPGAINSSQWQNELFALPYSSNGGFLYYRTDLVDEAPETWDEVMEVGIEKADEEGIGGFVGLGDQYEGFVVNYLQLFWSAGGELFDEAQENSTFLEGDAAERALDWLIDANENGLLA